MTVTVGPREPVRSRLANTPWGARPRRLWAVVLVALAVLGASLAAVLVGSSSRTGAPAAAASTRAVAARAASPNAATPAAAAGIAAAYGYPLRCLRITIAAADPAYARAHLDRTSAGGCARDRGYLNASFHRVDGTWRLILDEGQLFVPNDLLAR